MSEDANARRAICNRIKDELPKFSEDIAKESAQILKLEPEVDRLKAEIQERREHLDSIVTLVPRIVTRPSVGTIIFETGVTAANEVQRARIEGEINELEARLRPAERALDDARRRYDQARNNHDQTAANYERHRCAEFGQ